MEVTFREWKCNIKPGSYNNGRLALELIEVGTEEPIAVATVNLPEAQIGTDEVIIKDYSENTGMQQMLIAAGVIQPEELQRIPTGFVTCPVHKLTDEFKATLN